MTYSFRKIDRRWRLLVAAAALIALFLLLNREAYDGFFQDDEFDTLGWAPVLGVRDYAVALLTPLFSVDNFRPTGHLYFTIMSRLYWLNFSPYISPIFFFHTVNCALVYALLRKLKAEPWHALAGAAFFGLSAAAMDVYWKPMYVFDLLCTTFCLASILLFAARRWVLSFIAFWLAYKAKELAVMLPPVLLAYEFWLGRRKWIPLVPFFLASLSFGLQGILLNPNHDNGYTLRFTFDALRHTIPYYAHRLLDFRGSTLLLLPLALLGDRRIWFALFALGCFLFTLLFLPGRLFTAYFYLPLAFASVAMAIALNRFDARWAWGLLAIWFIFDTQQLRRARHMKLEQDDKIYAFIVPIQRWGIRHPGIATLVVDHPPADFHDWGVIGAWNTAHRAVGLKAFFRHTPEGKAALANETVALAVWDDASRTVSIQIHSPNR